MQFTLLRQLEHLLRPLRVRIANMVARAVVQNIDDSTKRQLLQIGVLAGEDIDTVEHFQPYGFKSVPLPGAEAIAFFPNGDRSHPLAAVVDDRRYRPTGWEPGEAGIYHKDGAYVKMTKDGDIIAVPKAGRQIQLGGTGLVDSDGVVHGSCPDPFTGVTHHALGGTSDIVRAKKEE